jgi:hypothetical protein
MFSPSRIQASAVLLTLLAAGAGARSGTICRQPSGRSYRYRHTQDRLRFHRLHAQGRARGRAPNGVAEAPGAHGPHILSGE